MAVERGTPARSKLRTAERRMSWGEIAVAGARALHAKSTPAQRAARARRASQRAAIMRRLRKLIRETDAEVEGWTEPWRE